MLTVASLNPPIRVKADTGKGEADFVAIAVVVDQMQAQHPLDDLQNKTALLAVALRQGSGETRAIQWLYLHSINWAAVPA